jgi:molecular chaperone HscA
MRQDADLLSAEETQYLENDMRALEEVLADDDPQTIREKTESLGRASEDFAARRMDRSIQQALRGVSVNALDADQS